MTSVRINPRDNNLGPISENDRARGGGGGGGAAAARPRGGPRVRGMRRLLYDESDEEGIFFRITLDIFFRITLFSMIILYYNFVIVSNPFFQITTPIPFTLGIRQAQRDTTS